ncbi:aromatic ring-hydroxylating dioxygenase subunit alpha [Pseudonocardia eucalypti]|uniref:Aromatic ring-hydroxylating dioxygenase subunit alpha n=1 Tax=Pseudonocardia eucalypti TaxID=648755 RepID=A0ABP9QJC4_9PSEU|nr:phenylpropionate dioxygenase-like ring-hydroxylating dioxygenase large terminal subunit [Pseudonocardia eucalypti]
MNRTLQREMAKRLFDHIDAKSTDRAPAEMTLNEADYVDAAQAARERDAIRLRPSLAAASGELPAPGDFRTTWIAGVPVLVTRQEDGSVRAFRNVCRHRCATVVAAEAGNSKAFSCPYHGWTYVLDGALRVVPDGEDSFPALDPADNGLVELPVAQRHGLIWVRPTPDGPLDLAAYLGAEVDREIAELGLDDYHFLRGQTFEQPANWKLIMDGFLEVYHVRYLHPKTVGKITIGNVFIVDALGEHLRMASARKDIEKLRPDRENPAGEQPDILPGIILTYALMPTTVLVYVRDHIEVWSIQPHETDPTRCRITLRFLVPELPQTDKAKSYWERNWDTVVGAVHDEDWEMARRIQAGLDAASVNPMTLGRNELGLHHFHRHLAGMTGS